MPIIIAHIHADQGAVLEVQIGPTQASAEPDAAKPVIVRAMIDTGAARSSIDRGIAERLKLQPFATADMITPAAPEPRQVKQYKIDMLLRHPQIEVQVGPLSVTEASLADQGFYAIIGRDVLSKALMTYDGPRGMMLLAL